MDTQVICKEPEKGGYCEFLLLNASCRLGTFLSPKWQGRPGVSERDLANAGFFVPLYHKRSAKDEVECRFCGVRISGWTLNDDPLFQHFKSSPNCPFLLGHPVKNIGLEENDPGALNGTAKTSATDEQSQIVIVRVGPPDNPLESKAAAHAGPYGPFEVPRNVSTTSRTQSSSLKAITSGSVPSSDDTFRAVVLWPHDPESLATEDQVETFTAHWLKPCNLEWTLNCPYCRYLFLFAKSRLLSFECQDWSPEPGVVAQNLAEAGFFLSVNRFRSAPDEIQCAFCVVRISNWKQNHDPLLRHSKYSPDCLLFKDSTKFANVPMKEVFFSPEHPVLRRNYYERLPDADLLGRCIEEPEPSTSGGLTRTSVKLCIKPGDILGTRDRPLVPFNFPQIDSTADLTNEQSTRTIFYPKPAYGEYTKEFRLATFPPNWSSLCPVPAEKLAEAGFFVLQNDLEWFTHRRRRITDVVTCFSCGVQLFGWHEEDDPRQVHQLFQRDCYFLASRPLSGPQLSRIKNSELFDRFEKMTKKLELLFKD